MTECDGYGRFSAEGQRGGTSEQRQIEGIQAACTKHGWRLRMLPFERAISARDGANLEPGSVLGNYMVEALQGKKRGRVFCTESMDRICRADVPRAMNFLLSLVTHGVTVHLRASGESVDNDAGVRELIRPLLDAEIAHKENEVRIDRVKRNIDARRRQAGTVFVARLPDWLTCPKKQKKGQQIPLDAIQPKPGAKELITEIMEWRAAGDGSILICARLNKLAETNPYYRPWRGDRWKPDTIVNLTSNIALLGKYQKHRTYRDKSKPRLPSGKYPLVREPLEIEGDYFPAMVGEDLWRRAQAAAKFFRERGSPGRPARSGVNLFQGLCRCGACGGPMYLTGKPGERAKSGKKRYAKHDRLVCAKAKVQGCPNTGHYSVQRLERAFLNQGLFHLHQASDFPAATAEIDALAARLTAAEAGLKEAQEAVTNAKRMILRAKTDDLAALAESAAQDALNALKDAERERDEAEYKLESAKGADPERTFREAEELAEACLAGHQESRRRMAGLIRSLIACVRFDYATYRAYYQSARAKHFELWADLSGDALVTGYRRRDWEEKKLAQAAE